MYMYHCFYGCQMKKAVIENPGPTLYHIINVFGTLRAEFSQGDQTKFADNAGKQCVAMSLASLIFRYIKPHIDTWDSPDLNNILYHGNCLYDCIQYFVKKILLVVD